jgi:pSer/pThr/pTyr-binding forkhead associated (FHA) protein
MTIHRDGFVTRISHDLYRRLVGDGTHGAQAPHPGGRLLEHHPGPARWHWLQDAMHHSIEQARAEAREHREIAQAQWFVLERIEFAPERHDLRQTLERFLQEFDNEARVGWIKRIWSAQGKDGILLDALQEVGLSAPVEHAPRDDAAYEEALRTQAIQDAEGDLAIRFVGSWQECPSMPAPEGSGAPQASLLIRDEAGERAVEMRGNALTLGVAGDIRVTGKYVSRRHLRLFVRDGSLWAEDAGSTNGVWVADERLAPHEQLEVRDRTELRLGAAQHAPALGDEECPRVVVTRIVARAADPGATPVLGVAATPVLGGPSPSAGAPLLTLTLAAAGWRRELPIHRLPFTLGRSHTCDECLPEENEAVSACHLRLVQLALPDGVWVEDLGSTRGSYLAGARSGGRFLLPLGETLTLGGSSLAEHHSPVQLTARRPRAEAS